MTTLTEYLAAIHTCYPELAVAQARLHNTDGQMNVIVIVNEQILFRFPRSQEVAATFATTAQLLERIQARVSLPIPQPVFRQLDPTAGQPIFMGYELLPGQPLWPATLAAIQSDHVLDRLAAQLARFLQELHALVPDELGIDLPVSDGRESWAQLYIDFRTQLFSYMRPDAQAAVSAQFDRFLSDRSEFAYTPTLRHGDLGGSNILYDAARQTITGIIDFDSLGVGDPALDAGALLSLGEEFFQRLCHNYPALAAMRPRVDFYRSTYALQEALYGLRDGLRDSFEAGIANYR